MKCSLGMSNFLEEISSLSDSIVSSISLHWSLREAFLSLLGYSLELCIQMLISFLFFSTFCFSSFHSYLGDWNAKVGSQETPWVTGKFGLEIRNEAGQRIIEFWQANALVITNTLFQQHKRRLYTWTSPGGQHWNQIDYILCSQRWRSKNKTRSWLWLRSWTPYC